MSKNVCYLLGLKDTGRFFLIKKDLPDFQNPAGLFQLIYSDITPKISISMKATVWVAVGFANTCHVSNT